MDKTTRYRCKGMDWNDPARYAAGCVVMKRLVQNDLKFEGFGAMCSRETTTPDLIFGRKRFTVVQG